MLLVIGNMLETFFTIGVFLGRLLTDGVFQGSEVACKVLMFLYSLGPNVANMAVAALALHVLLTSLSRNQGNRLRHGLVLSLFVLLSFLVPSSKVSSRCMLLG